MIGPRLVTEYRSALMKCLSSAKPPWQHIDLYRREVIPLIVPITLINH